MVEALAQDLVVVNFAVDGEGDGFVIGEDGLGAGVDADDREAFMDEDGVVGGVVAAPVRAAVCLDAVAG